MIPGDAPMPKEPVNAFDNAGSSRRTVDAEPYLDAATLRPISLCEKAPVVYKAAGDEYPLFSGGSRIPV